MTKESQCSESLIMLITLANDMIIYIVLDASLSKQQNK